MQEVSLLYDVTRPFYVLHLGAETLVFLHQTKARPDGSELVHLEGLQGPSGYVHGYLVSGTGLCKPEVNIDASYP